MTNEISDLHYFVKVGLNVLVDGNEYTFKGTLHGCDSW